MLETEDTFFMKKKKLFVLYLFKINANRFVIYFISVSLVCATSHSIYAVSVDSQIASRNLSV